MSIVLLTYVQDRNISNDKILLPQPKCILPFINRIKKQIQTDLKRKLY